MPGGILQLIAIGLNDLYLIGSPQITLFKIVYRRYSNFSLCTTTMRPYGNTDAGCDFIIKLDNRGDLVHHINLIVQIPQINIAFDPATCQTIKNILKQYNIIWNNNNTLQKVSLIDYNNTLVPLINTYITQNLYLYDYFNLQYSRTQNLDINTLLSNALLIIAKKFLLSQSYYLLFQIIKEIYIYFFVTHLTNNPNVSDENNPSLYYADIFPILNQLLNNDTALIDALTDIPLQQPGYNIITIIADPVNGNINFFGPPLDDSNTISIIGLHHYIEFLFNFNSININDIINTVINNTGNLLLSNMCIYVYEPIILQYINTYIISLQTLNIISNNITQYLKNIYIAFINYAGNQIINNLNISIDNFILSQTFIDITNQYLNSLSPIILNKLLQQILTNSNILNTPERYITNSLFSTLLQINTLNDTYLLTQEQTIIKNTIFTNGTLFSDVSLQHKYEIIYNGLYALYNDIINFPQASMTLINGDSMRILIFNYFLDHIIKNYLQIPTYIITNNIVDYNFPPLAYLNTSLGSNHSVFNPYYCSIKDSIVLYQIIDANIISITQDKIGTSTQLYFETLISLFYNDIINTQILNIKNYKTTDAYIIYTKYLEQLTQINSIYTSITNLIDLNYVSSQILNSINWNILLNFDKLMTIFNFLQNGSDRNNILHYRLGLIQIFLNMSSDNAITIIKKNSYIETINLSYIPELNDNIIVQLSTVNIVAPTNIVNYFNDTVSSGVKQFTIDTQNILQIPQYTDYLNNIILFEQLIINANIAIDKQTALTTRLSNTINTTIVSNINYIASFGSYYANLAILNYIPYLTVRDIPILINDVLKSSDFNFIDNINLASFLEYFNLQDTDESSITLSFPDLALKNQLYTSIANNIIFLPNNSIYDDSYFEKLQTKYATNATNILLTYVFRPEELLPEYYTVNDNTNIVLPIGKTTYLPIDCICSTYLNRYITKITTYVNTWYAINFINTNIYTQQNCIDQIVLIITNVINCFNNYNIPSYANYINNNYTLYNIASNTSNLLNNTPKYCDAISSLYLQIQKLSIQKYNGLINNILLSEKYFNTNLGTIVSQIFTQYQSQIINYNNLCDNVVVDDQYSYIIALNTVPFSFRISSTPMNLDQFGFNWLILCFKYIVYWGSVQPGMFPDGLFPSSINLDDSMTITNKISLSFILLQTIDINGTANQLYYNFRGTGSVINQFGIFIKQYLKALLSLCLTNYLSILEPASHLSSSIYFPILQQVILQMFNEHKYEITQIQIQIVGQNSNIINFGRNFLLQYAYQIFSQDNDQLIINQQTFQSILYDYTYILTETSNVNFSLSQQSLGIYEYMLYLREYLIQLCNLFINTETQNFIQNIIPLKDIITQFYIIQLDNILLLEHPQQSLLSTQLQILGSNSTINDFGITFLTSHGVTLINNFDPNDMSSGLFETNYFFPAYTTQTGIVPFNWNYTILGPIPSQQNIYNYHIEFQQYTYFLFVLFYNNYQIQVLAQPSLIAQIVATFYANFITQINDLTNTYHLNSLDYSLDTTFGFNSTYINKIQNSVYTYYTINNVHPDIYNPTISYFSPVIGSGYDFYRLRLVSNTNVDSSYSSFNTIANITSAYTSQTSYFTIIQYVSDLSSYYTSIYTNYNQKKIILNLNNITNSITTNTQTILKKDYYFERTAQMILDFINAINLINKNAYYNSNNTLYNIILQIITDTQNIISTPTQYISPIDVLTSTNLNSPSFKNSLQTNLQSIYQIFNVSQTAYTNPYDQLYYPNMYNWYNNYSSDTLVPMSSINTFLQPILLSISSGTLYTNKYISTKYTYFATYQDIIFYLLDIIISYTPLNFLLTSLTPNITNTQNNILHAINNKILLYQNNFTNITSIKNNIALQQGLKYIFYQLSDINLYQTSTGFPILNTELETLLLKLIMDGGPKFAWYAELGHKLIETITVNIGGQDIETHTCDLLHLIHKLYDTVEHERGYNIMIGNIEEMYVPSTQQRLLKQLIIPLRFWFCRNAGLALPLINLLYSPTTLKIKFNKLEDILWTEQPSYFIKKPKFKCYAQVEYVYIDDDERIKINNSKLEYLMERFMFGGSCISNRNTMQTADIQNINYIVPKAGYSIYISLNGLYDPTKYLVWTVKIYDPKTNISSNPNTINWQQYGYNVDKHIYPIFDNIKIQFNGKDREASKEEIFYTCVMPWQKYTGNLDEGEYLYSFALFPLLLQPSGAANMTQIEDSKIIFYPTQVILDKIVNNNLQMEIKVWSCTYNVLRIISGIGALAFYH
jgi:hypothetical protein